MGFLGSLFKKKAPVEKRPPAPSAMTWRATSVTRETPTTVSFELDGAMTFKAGQFVLLRPNASMPWRAYSFSRSPKQTPLRLTVKAVAGGTVSVHLNEKLKQGDTLEVKGPFGHFTLPETFARGLFVAGGSGITPFLSMLHEQAEKGWPTPITLLDFNRAANEQILKTELDALVAGSGGKLTVVHELDDARGGPPSKDQLGTILKAQAAPDVVAMCGPQPLMDLVRELVMKTFPTALVLEEKFTVSHEGDAGGATHQVEFMVNGTPKPFAVKDGEHVLAAARKAGLNLSAGCEMGACGVCRVKVLSGAIDVPDDACLSDGEKSDGYALVCVGTVKGAARIEPAP